MRQRFANIFFWFIFFIAIFVIVGVAWWVIRSDRQPVTVALIGDELAEPRQAVILQFSEPMRPESFFQKIFLHPAIVYESLWQNNNTKLLLEPKHNWPFETDVQVILGKGKSQRLRVTEPQVVTLSTPRYPKVVTFSPADGSKDVLLGIEDPLFIELDRSSQYVYLDFRLDPPVSVVYRNNPDKTEFQILPQQLLKPGQQYTLAVWVRGKNESDEKYRFLGQTTFTTLSPLPDSWSRDLAERTQEAKRYTRPVKVVGKYIDINLTSQVMTLFEDGRAIDAFIISSGKRGMDTPKGEFFIHNKAERPWSKRYGLYMPYWQAITPDGLFGIHELPEWPGGYKEGANHLGTPVSHGCVRLGVGPAKRVYEWTEIGTLVIVY